ncbi:MAG: LysM peptidoglycan-binding domain-containing protein [Akkermansiaceae bacterium]
MQFIIVAITALGIGATFLLTSCGTTDSGSFVKENKTNRGYSSGIGPFDSNGNYVERWANDKSKANKWRTAKVVNPSGTAVAATKPAVTSPTLAYTAPVTPQSSSATPPSVQTPTITTPKTVVQVQQKPKPKPKPVVKAKPKHKPPVRYTVKKGDTLWALSQKYNVSVTAIQGASGIKGTNLKIGSVLLIPQY